MTYRRNRKVQLIKSPLRESQEQSDSQGHVEEALLNQEERNETLNDSSSDKKNGNAIQTIPLLENVQIENSNVAACQTDSQLNVSHRNENSALPHSNSHTLNNIRY